jgi:hypothetical protein
MRSAADGRGQPKLVGAGAIIPWVNLSVTGNGDLPLADGEDLVGR